jgi:dihydroflavonol-4-reductase
MATRPDLATTGLTLTAGVPDRAVVATPERAASGCSNGLDPEPSQWPVLVTGAGGFVGGHVARDLASAGHFVRGLARRPPPVKPGDPSIEWMIGDLLDPELRRRALAGVRAVIHTAGWASLGPDRLGISRSSNVESTRHLLAEAAPAGVERFVHTSTLYTLAAGTQDQCADEFTAWNLQRVDSAYTQTKREAERLVLSASQSRFTTIALCPGMVLGPRDPKPTSTKIVRAFSRAAVAVLPQGGIPIVDASLLALAHRRALTAGGAGERYAVVGPYLSYRDMAMLVASITGRPRWLVPLPDRLEPLLVLTAGWFAPIARRWWPDASRQLAAGGFLRLYVRGDRANACFGLQHPPARETIARSLE